MHELHGSEDLTETARGWVLGDRNYQSPKEPAFLDCRAQVVLTRVKNAAQTGAGHGSQSALLLRQTMEVLDSPARIAYDVIIDNR